jgi:hypothetical protein
MRIGHQGSKACHDASSERIKDNIPWFSVMQDISGYCLWWNLRVIGMSAVNRVTFTLMHIRYKWFLAVIICSRVIGLSVKFDEILKKRIRAGRIIRRIG